jgi:hypothetical protein
MVNHFNIQTMDCDRKIQYIHKWDTGRVFDDCRKETTLIRG